MSTLHATPANGPTDDELTVCSRLRDLAHHADADADDLLARGDHNMAAIRLTEASELYRLAAHHLDHDISPSVAA